MHQKSNDFDQEIKESILIKNGLFHVYFSNQQFKASLSHMFQDCKRTHSNLNQRAQKTKLLNVLKLFKLVQSVNM